MHDWSVGLIVFVVLLFLVFLVIGLIYTRKIYRERYPESSKVLAVILLVIGLFFWPLLLGPVFIYWLGH